MPIEIKEVYIETLRKVVFANVAAAEGMTDVYPCLSCGLWRRLGWHLQQWMAMSRSLGGS